MKDKHVALILCGSLLVLAGGMGLIVSKTDEIVISAIGMAMIVIGTFLD